MVAQDDVAELFLATQPPVAKPPTSPPDSKQKAKPTPSAHKVADELVEQYLLKDAEIKGLLQYDCWREGTIGQTEKYCRGADTLPENKGDRDSQIVEKLEQQIEQRKVQLRPARVVRR